MTAPKVGHICPTCSDPDYPYPGQGVRCLINQCLDELLGPPPDSFHPGLEALRRPAWTADQHRAADAAAEPAQDPANQVRSTALFQLATEIPAAILARTLGIHTDVAVAWQRLSAGDRADYAAEISRRTST
ncbi:hypothetical protein [Streptosporangium sp. NBC_01756]|uniref:hypothetical protein n=1 Tax=Streptosporangium sp. NBC_01756 TaxID=2975950 RepID=UPI002DDBCD1D|nr:hypothetical protein [Streptosporangium sp. NBC_01756]WSC90426.1 hypothetical protein OIE48_20310 [Streptosporangium sp. NBC_01756]